MKTNLKCLYLHTDLHIVERLSQGVREEVSYRDATNVRKKELHFQKDKEV